MTEKKPRKEPFEIDKAAIARLNKRIETVSETRTVNAVRNGVKATGLEALGTARVAALKSLSEVEKYLMDKIAQLGSAISQPGADEEEQAQSG